MSSFLAGMVMGPLLSETWHWICTFFFFLMAVLGLHFALVLSLVVADGGATL